MEDTERLVNILLKLSKNPKAAFARDDREAIDNAKLGDIALAQQSMLKNGVSAEELWALWHKYKDILPDQESKLRSELPDNHVLRKVMAEHEMMLCFIAELEEVSRDIGGLESGSSLTHEI